MDGFIKTSKRKTGGTFYALLPVEYCKAQEILGDEEILIQAKKYVDVVKEMCEKAEGKMNTLITKDNRELIGVVVFVDKKSITFVCDGKEYIIPYSHIKELKEIKPKEAK